MEPPNLKAVEFDPAAAVDPLAALIELPLDPAHRPGVVKHFAIIAGMARLVMDFPLADDIEPAPVFLP
jgi:hypothetical protein